MPTITKREGGRWQARVRRRGYPEQSDTFRTRAEAERWARALEQQFDSGAHPQPTDRRFTLADAVDKYKAVSEAKRGADQESHRLRMWAAHELASRPLTLIRPADVSKHRRERLAAGMSPNTVRLELALLSHIFTTARLEWGMQSLANPVAEIKLPSVVGTERDRRMTADEARRMAAAAKASPSPWLPAVIELAVETAMRRGELAAVRTASYYGGVVRLLKTKNGAARSVPLSPAARAALRALRDKNGEIVMPTPKAITQAFVKAVKVAKVEDLTFHDLRHEATSRLFELGLSLQEVASITGHKTWSQLKRYTHPKAETIAEKLAAARAMRKENSPRAAG